MKNIVDFPDRSTLAEEAAQWLILLDRDEKPSRAEIAQLRDWLRRSPAHREELKSLAELWGNLNVLTELAVPMEQSRGHNIRGFFYLMMHRWTAATTGICLLFAAAVSVLLLSLPTPLGNTNGYYSTAVGQQVNTTLADGSTIFLNTDTQVKVEFSENTRSIHLLQGEVYFDVAHMENTPFRVYAAGGRIQAIGTAFTVRINEDKVDVTVTEGKVSLASVLARANRSLQTGATDSQSGSVEEATLDIGTLSAGQIGSFLGSSGSADDFANSVQEVEELDIQRRLSWREGVLTFSGEPLELVVKEVSRYTRVNIEIADPDVRAIRIGGRFPVGETTAMLQSLEENFGLRVTRLDQDHVLLSSAIQ